MEIKIVHLAYVRAVLYIFIFPWFNDLQPNEKDKETDKTDLRKIATSSWHQKRVTGQGKIGDWKI